MAPANETSSSPQSATLASSWSKDVVLRMFPTGAAANVDKNFPRVEAALDEQFARVNPPLTADEKLRLRLYIYATIRAETSNFTPREEGISRLNTHPLSSHWDAHRRKTVYEFVSTSQQFGPWQPQYLPFGMYDFKGKGTLGNHGVGDGSRFKGRGFIQITGRFNYDYYGRQIGCPTLVTQPELAADAQIAAELAAAYVTDGARMDRILDATASGNYAAARRALNGGTNGLDDFEAAYRSGLEELRKQAARRTPTTPSPAPQNLPPPVRIRQT